MNLLNDLVTQIVSLNNLQHSFLQTAISRLTPDDINSLEAYIKYCSADGVSVSYLAECYNLIVKETLKEQIHFKRYKRYRYSQYHEVAELVYHNHEYMNMYMHGLALTAFLWPNHTSLMSYFRNTLPKNENGNYIEIGPGHGFYFMEAMRLSHFEQYYGVDLSPTSVMMTNALVKSGYFGNFSNYKIEQSDFLQWDTQVKFDAVVMGEVLEHVEQPENLLRKINDISKQDSYIFITTCINAPAIDHIYLFKNFEQLNNTVEHCKLYVKDHRMFSYSNLSIEEALNQSLPINVALLLGKKQ